MEFREGGIDEILALIHSFTGRGELKRKMIMIDLLLLYAKSFF